MFKFILSRLLQSVVVIFVILTVTFFMVRQAPGSPFTAERKYPPHVLRNLDAYYGFDQPQIVQFGNYLKNLARGDLGPALFESRTVNEVIADTFPVSLQLGLYALIIAIGIGIPFGVVAAVRRNSGWDYSLMSFSMVGICFPTFVIGPVLSLIFAVWLGWFRVAGWYQFSDAILPSLALGMVYAAYLARITRSGMLEVLNQDYIRTAQAKGVPFRDIVLKHALKGGLLPVVSFMGPALAGIISGSFVIEMVFQLDGLGRQFVKSAFNRDYYLVQGTVLIYGVLIVLANLLVDIVQVVLNPRLRFEDK